MSDKLFLTHKNGTLLNTFRSSFLLFFLLAVRCLFISVIVASGGLSYSGLQKGSGTYLRHFCHISTCTIRVSASDFHDDGLAYQWQRFAVDHAVKFVSNYWKNELAVRQLMRNLSIMQSLSSRKGSFGGLMFMHPHYATEAVMLLLDHLCG